jgi:hypothetical protein
MSQPMSVEPSGLRLSMKQGPPLTLVASIVATTHMPSAPHASGSPCGPFADQQAVPVSKDAGEHGWAQTLVIVIITTITTRKIMFGWWEDQEGKKKKKTSR